MSFVQFLRDISIKNVDFQGKANWYHYEVFLRETERLPPQ